MAGSLRPSALFLLLALSLSLASSAAEARRRRKAAAEWGIEAQAAGNGTRHKRCEYHRSIQLLANKPSLRFFFSHLQNAGTEQ